MGLQAFTIMLAQIPKIRGRYGPTYSQLSRKLPQQGGKNLVLAMQNHSPPKPPKLTLAFTCLRENSGTIFGQFQFLHTLQELHFLCLYSLQFYTKVERLGSQPHSPLPTLCTTAHASAHLVALHSCRRVAGNDSSGILGELQLQLFCFTAKKLQQIMFKNEHVHVVTPPLLQSGFMLWKAEISISHAFNEKTKDFKRKILNLRFCTIQLMPRQAEVLISLAISHKCFPFRGPLITLSVWKKVKLFLCSCARSVRHKMVAEQLKPYKIHYGNQELQLGSTDQLSHYTMKARTDLNQIKHNFPIFSFRNLKKFILCSSTTEAKQVEQRNWMHKNQFSQAAHHDTPQVKWLCTESRIQRYQLFAAAKYTSWGM